VRLALVILFLAVAAAFFAAIPLGFPAVRLYLKPLPVLILAAGLAARPPRSTLERAIMAGLVASALGDVLLEADHFLAGLLAFLAAHMAYAVGFWSDERILRPWRAWPFVLWGALVLLALRPGLEKAGPPVFVYVLAILVMMWRAAARVRPSLRTTGLTLAGAIAFGLSDTLVALSRFREALAWADVPIMVLYWAGQAGIAQSLPLVSKERS
jgi:uncharacterized membrane protein YhhN